MSRPRCSSAVAFQRRLERFPPILVRLLARDPRGKPLSTQEIAKRSGLPLMRVDYLSYETTWKYVGLADFLAFCSACNLRPFDSKQCKNQEIYLNGKLVNGERTPPQFDYLKRSPEWESFYKPLMARYVMSLKGAVK